MPSWRNKPADTQNYLKRRTVEQGLAMMNEAHVATQRLYCDVLKFWRGCRFGSCKRHRRCMGRPTDCLLRGVHQVSPAQRLVAREQVIAGGPRRIKPANNMEREVRRSEFKSVASWRLG
jgi:hypothetical protein